MKIQLTNLSTKFKILIMLIIIVLNYAYAMQFIRDAGGGKLELKNLEVINSLIDDNKELEYKFPVVISFNVVRKLKSNNSTVLSDRPCIGVISNDKFINNKYYFRLTTAKACLLVLSPYNQIDKNIEIKVLHTSSNTFTDLGIKLTKHSFLEDYKGTLTAVLGNIQLSFNKSIIGESLPRLNIVNSIQPYLVGFNEDPGVSILPLYLFGSERKDNNYFLSSHRYFGGWTLEVSNIPGVSLYVINASAGSHASLENNTSGSSILFSSQDGDLGAPLFVDGGSPLNQFNANFQEYINPLIIGFYVGSIDGNIEPASVIYVAKLIDNYK